MNLATKAFCLTLATFLSAGLVTTAGAADAAPAAAGATAQTPINQVQELDEILVRGKRLRDAIADAEDDFFALYNKLNKDDDYSTSCIYVNTDPDSQIKSRLCIPGFLADALADQVYFAEQCQSPGQDEDGNDFPPPPCYTPPPPTLVLQERSKDYANNLKKVIKSDDRLGSMAGNLDNLYHELVGVQTQYLKVKAAELQAKEPAKASDKSGN
jgi:hypothetical protein